VSHRSRHHFSAQEGFGVATCRSGPDPASLLGSAPVLSHAPRLLSVPCRPGTPAYKLQVKIRRRTCFCALSRALRLRILPPCQGRLWRCHVPHGSRPHLPAREGSRAATCRTAPNPASLLGRALMLPHVSQLQTPSPYSRGLQCCYMSHGSGPASLLGRAPTLSRAHGFGPRFPAREGSGAIMCPTTLDPASLLRGGGGSSASLQNKERLTCKCMQQGLRVFKTRPCVTEALPRCAGRRRYHDLQTVRIDATIPRYSWQRL
jgi:hypothetical protein